MAWEPGLCEAVFLPVGFIVGPQTGVTTSLGTLLSVSRADIFLGALAFLNLDFIFLFDTERERAQVGGEAEREGEAGFLLSQKPDVGFDPRTSGS